MKKKVVISQSTVSAGQLKDLFRMIDDGTIGNEEMGAFLASPRKFSQGGLTTIRAINILGQGKVITNEQAAKAWSEGAVKSVAIRYSETTLRICAEQNQSGQADWRLVYCHGFSLREQRDKRRTDQSNQPCFYGNDWWLNSVEDKWATYKPQAGYYLINFCGQFANMNWKTQEAEIAKLGKDYERCHEAVFSEAILTIYMVNNGERIAENWWHWGVSLASNGFRVFVGYLNSNGLDVYYHWLDYSLHVLRVCVFRKFEN